MKTPSLSPFCRAYLITALWSSTDENGDPLDDKYGLDDLAPATIKQAIADCADFENAQAETLAAAIATGKVKCGPDFDAYGRAGHDFWLTRNGHGAGFWDGDWPKPYGRILTDAAHVYGSVDLYVGDDGLIYG
jgi:hypothetical protein